MDHRNALYNVFEAILTTNPPIKTSDLVGVYHNDALRNNLYALYNAIKS